MKIIIENDITKVVPDFTVMVGDFPTVKGYDLEYYKKYKLKPITISKKGLDYPIYIEGCPYKIDESDLLYLFEYDTIKNLIILDYKIKQLFNNK